MDVQVESTNNKQQPLTDITINNQQLVLADETMNHQQQLLDDAIILRVLQQCSPTKVNNLRLICHQMSRLINENSKKLAKNSIAKIVIRYLPEKTETSYSIQLLLRNRYDGEKLFKVYQEIPIDIEQINQLYDILLRAFIHFNVINVTFTDFNVDGQLNEADRLFAFVINILTTIGKKLNITICNLILPILKQNYQSSDKNLHFDRIDRLIIKNINWKQSDNNWLNFDLSLVARLYRLRKLDIINYENDPKKQKLLFNDAIVISMLQNNYANQQSDDILCDDLCYFIKAWQRSKVIINFTPIEIDRDNTLISNEFELSILNRKDELNCQYDNNNCYYFRHSNQTNYYVKNAADTRKILLSIGDDSSNCVGIKIETDECQFQPIKLEIVDDEMPNEL